MCYVSRSAALGLRLSDATGPVDRGRDVAASPASTVPLLVIAALISTFRILSRIQRLARFYQLREIAFATICVQMGMVGFLTSAFFLNVAYLFYLPSLTGLASKA